jgi:hypothetical protein
MAMSNNLSASPVPTYIIYREVAEGQLYDATAPLAFYPAKDSDELFDALRAKFPHLKSHSDRMRDATIEFLLQEREAESLSANVSPAMTTLSSPEMTNLATPSFDYSPQPQIPHMIRQQSSAATPSDAQTPALDSMTSVFSLSTTEQPKQRVRRKMTPDEKADYRKRRIVKACESCSKRKRKVGLLPPIKREHHANSCLVCPQPVGDGEFEEELQRQSSTQSHQASVCRDSFSPHRLNKANQQNTALRKHHKRPKFHLPSTNMPQIQVMFSLQMGSWALTKTLRCCSMILHLTSPSTALRHSTL